MNQAGAAQPDAESRLFAPKPAIEHALDQFVGELHLPVNLVDAIEYALMGGGKRLRPVLAWWSACAVGAPGDASLPAAVAVELIHTFSLVHDDLPAMDDDDLRRGRPTLHKHTTEAMAILAGDAMLSLAYTHLAEQSRLIGGELASALVVELAAGTNGMIAGQVYDTLGCFEPSMSARDRLDQIHLNKTGALIAASCRMGAMLGLARKRPGVAQEPPAAITNYARDIGLMFQAVDDLIDVTQPTDHAGKRTGKDASAGKLTFPVVLGVEATKAEVERLRNSARECLKPLGDAAAPLAELADLLAARSR
ncbi:MAG: polyprenyl synthetase family protein [Tepidisphaera sp.]